MRSLLIGKAAWPWPPASGESLRLANVAEALAELGEVDFLGLVSGERMNACRVPPDAPVARAMAMPAGPAERPSLHRLHWLARGRLPLELHRQQYDEMRHAFTRWARRYDLVWYHRLGSYLALSEVVEAPAIVDLDDLEDKRELGRLEVIRADNADGRMRGWARLAQGRRNARLWRDLQLSVSASVPAVVVCSDLDREHLGLANAFVVENGFTPPVRPAGRASAGDPPTVMLQGSLRYHGNIDAARFLTEQIAPRLRDRVPGVRVRLVGRADERIRRLADPPQVTVTGWVPDLESELADADVVAVPLRYAGGTRIKILEAFAHRIPVVSTTVGAEGLDVVPGRHLLVADDAESFAAACQEVLRDPDLRRRLADEAEALVLRRYRWSRIHEDIAALAARLAGLDPVARGAVAGAAVRSPGV